MLIPAAGDPEHKQPALRLPVPLFLCPVHFKDASAQDFQTKQWRADMRTALDARGATAVPDFDNAWLEIVPFQEGLAPGEAVQFGHA